MSSSRQIFAQLAIGKQELTRFSELEIIRRITSAKTQANLGALMFRPSPDERMNDTVLAHCRELGIDIYLWYPVLANAFRKPNQDEVVVDAWGGKGHGQSGFWQGINQGEESFLFACPRSLSYITDIVDDCRGQLDHYDGIFLDRIRYPSPANGIESLFTCFCPRCLEYNPEAKRWRENARDFRRFVEQAPPDTLPYWPNLVDLIRQHGLNDLLKSRMHNILKLGATFTNMASSLGKKVAFDLFAPSLALFVGQNYQALGTMADWLKPILYCRALEPTSLPLELLCLARGFSRWGNGRFSENAMLAYYRRSLNMPEIPDTLEALEKNGLSVSAARREYALSKQTRMTFPGFESVCHPAIGLKMSTTDLSDYLDAFADASTLIPSWNILYIPESYLELIAPRDVSNSASCAS